MKTWTSAIALIVAGTMLVGSAFAQATSPSGDQSKDKAKSGSPSAGSSSTDMKGSTDTKATTDTTKSDSSAKPDMGKSDMKSSDAAKPDTMKSDMKAAKRGKGGGMAQGGDMEQVRAVQQALKDKGHDPGEIDGKMGPKTQAALRDYQSKEGLKATGRLDAETMAKLGVEAKTGAAGATASPSASPKTDSKTDSSASGAAATPKSGADASSSASGSASPSSGSSSTPQSGASDTKSDTTKK